MNGLALRSVAILASGTALGHAITALSMPVLTRLYTPQDFSTSAVFTSILAIVTVAACLRLEVAIPLPADDADAVNLLAMSSLFAVVVGVVIVAIVTLLPLSAMSMLGEGAVFRYLWLVPIGVVFGGVYLAMQMWFSRRAQFRSLASSRIVQSSGASGTQIGLGIAGVAPLGLVVGQIVSFVAGAVMLSAMFLRRDRQLLKAVRWSRMKSVLATYQNFPRYSVWEALANTGATHIPILLIAAYAVGPEPGYLGLAMLAFQAPMALLGNAVGQVFFAEAAVAVREGRLADYTLATLNRLIPVILAPAVAIAILAPQACAIVFGSEWERSGILIAWMMPWFVLQFLASPVSTVLHAVGRQRTAMNLQVVGFVGRIGSVLVAGLVVPGFVTEIYALSGGLLYGVYLMIVIHAANVVPGDLVPALRRQLPWVALSVLVATGAAFGVGEVMNAI